jgi:hypothetical protein
MENPKRMTGLRRSSAILTALVLLGAALSALVASPANGLAQDPIVLHPNDLLEVNYDPILLPNPANEADDPETCKTAPYCYTIPLHLDRPAGMSPDEEFTIRVRMSWQVDVEDVEVPVQGEVTSNDLDLKIWNSPYTANDERGEPTEPVNEGGATGAQPEKTSMNTPPKNDYYLVVTNFIGLNRGFKLTLTWEPEVFASPFEDLGDGARPTDLSAETTAITPSFASPDAGFAAVSPSSDFFGDSITGDVDATVTDTPRLSPIVVNPDDFIDDAGNTDLEKDLLDEARALSARPASLVRPAKPVSAALVIFWLGVVPLLLIIAAAVYLRRRRPAALSL